MFKDFKVDEKRDLLVPNVKCYQMDLSSLVEGVKQSHPDFNTDFLPSWKKVCTHPYKAKGFWTQLFEALFLGRGNYDELNVDFQTENYNSNKRVAQMFVNANNNQLTKIADIASEALPGYAVKSLSGSETNNAGKKITNHNIQETVNDIVESEENKNILIITDKLGQRSFSVPKLSEVFLAYDRGKNGTTIQRMSRALTPDSDSLDKVGRVFSLSFDPNRDDKLDEMLTETAINVKKRHKTNDLTKAFKKILRTIDIFSCQPDGAVKMDEDSYLKSILERKSVSRVLGKMINLNLLTPEAINAIANGNTNYFRNQYRTPTQTGKTTEYRTPTQTGKTTEKMNNSPNNNNNNSSSKSKDLANIRKVLISLIENLDIIVYGTESTNLNDAFKRIENDESIRLDIEKEFKISFEILKNLFEIGVINQNQVELMKF